MDVRVILTSAGYQRCIKGEKLCRSYTKKVWVFGVLRRGHLAFGLHGRICFIYGHTPFMVLHEGRIRNIMSINSLQYQRTLTQVTTAVHPFLCTKSLTPSSANTSAPVRPETMLLSPSAPLT